MNDKLTARLAAFEQFLTEKGWQIFAQKEIEHGRQLIVTDSSTRVPVNFYHTGKIVPQGKVGEMKSAITEWANLFQSGVGIEPSGDRSDEPKNRVAKYLVLPDNITPIHNEVVTQLPGEILEKEPTGPAEVYRVEVRQESHRITITQYESGTLLVQGLSGPLFDTVCEALDEHLTQSFSERATRFIPGEAERAATTLYLESVEAENEAARWLLQQIDRSVQEFLYPNDQRTLLSAAGVRNAIYLTGQTLPDYSVAVMPFAKAYEGFLIRLAAHLELINQEALTRRASSIEIATWLETIKGRLPDAKRYAETSDALVAAWGCRNKAVHSDFAHPLSVLKTLTEAEQEIVVILRAMSRAYRIFVEEGVKLQLPQEAKSKEPSEPEIEYKFENVDREALRRQLEADGLPVMVQVEGRKHVWEILDKPALTVIAPRSQEGLIIVKGQTADEFCTHYRVLLEGQLTPGLDSQPEPTQARIGVDESGKGDLLGPLVVAGVLLTSESELTLARHGVRDSKEISDIQIAELAEMIKKNCQVEVLVLLPPEYNSAYERHGRNLNRLLAWGHAQVIARLSHRMPVGRAISDQFGDESLVLEALAAEGCSVPLEQRPRAESDLAVAAASVVARAEFVAAISEYSAKAGFEIPLGSSSPQVEAIGKRIYRRWGKRGLERIAKMHFKTINEIIGEGKP